MLKYTPQQLQKLEAILSQSDYVVRYEKGNFQSGWCVLEAKKVVVLNKFLDVEGKIVTLQDLIPQINIQYDKLTIESQRLFDKITSSNKLEALNTEETKIDTV